MKNAWIKAAMLVTAGLATLHSPALADVADRVVAVVGNDVILKSDVDSRVLMARMQSPEQASKKDFQKTVLNTLIDQKIMLAKAKIDSLKIDESAVESSSSERYRQISERFMSKSEMEARFAKSSAGILEEIRKEMRSQELVDALRKKRSSATSVTYEEVMAYFNANRAMVGELPEMVSVSQILKFPGVSEASKASASALIHQVRSEILGGADFAVIARRYSQDPGSAKLGGDLGYVQKGELIQSFEDAAFALKEGALSDIVETRYGYHVIQMLNKDSNSIHIRHILIAFDHSNLNFAGELKLLGTIRADVQSGKADFADMARKYSDDPASARLGGLISAAGGGTSQIATTSIRKELRQIIQTLKSAGDVSEPKRIDPPQGEPFLAIFRLNERFAAHRLDPEKDYALIEEKALDEKNRVLFDEWLKQLRKEVYVRISDI